MPLSLAVHTRIALPEAPSPSCAARSAEICDFIEAAAGDGRANRADSITVSVTETFFSVEVEDMQRATAFYVNALGATVVFSSARWSSLRVAGVRIGLAVSPELAPRRVGLHFAVSDLASARAAVERAGGCIASTPTEVAPGVVIVRVTDTEGNTFTLSGGPGS
jgi:predicted enzyme related to lactoylglutathione lyase